MREVMFIRHGETTDNADGCIPGNNCSLTPLGQRDIERLQQATKNFAPDLVCYGTTTRAKESAAILLGSLELPEFKSFLFDERQLPSGILGKSHASESVRKIIEDMRTNAPDPLWHHSDEENYSEFIARVTHMLTMAFSLEESRAVIVTHAGVMKVLWALISSEKSALERFLKIDDEYTVRSGGVMRLTQTKPGMFAIKEADCFLPRKA